MKTHIVVEVSVHDTRCRPGSKVIKLRRVANGNNHRIGNCHSIISLFVTWFERFKAIPNVEEQYLEPAPVIEQSA